MERNEGETQIREFTAEESALAKNKAQQEAISALEENYNSGLIVMATGSGKSKVAINICQKVVLNTRDYVPRILLVVPTEKLRDETWKNEFDKWLVGNIWAACVLPTCYASLHNIKGSWDLVILDECHHLTITNSIALIKNECTWKNIIGLTATAPTDPVKKAILKELGLDLVYNLTLDRAVELGVVAPYSITMIGLHLDIIDKYIQGGSKAKPFYTTETKSYIYYNKLYEEAPNEFNARRRQQFIYGLKSKTEAARKILEYLIPQEKRGLIFCGTKEQADNMDRYRYYSKPTRPKKPNVANIKKYTEQVLDWQNNKGYELFSLGQVNRLACVSALDEGINVNDLDFVMMVQIFSSHLKMVQRLGRGIRFREDHIGRVIGIYTKDTIDEQWAWNAVRGFDKNNIKWVDYDKLRRGEDTINI